MDKKLYFRKRDKRQYEFKFSENGDIKFISYYRYEDRDTAFVYRIFSSLWEKCDFEYLLRKELSTYSPFSLGEINKIVKWATANSHN